MKKLVNKLTKKVNDISIFFVALLICILSVTTVLASGTSEFSQTITAGSLATDIVDASFVTVASPAVSLDNTAFSFSCQISTTTDALGTATEQLYVSNPDASDTGWKLNIAATDPTDVWASAGTDFDFNEAGTKGCVDDGATTDAGDALAGQLRLDPTGGVIGTGNCSGCTVTGVSVGGYDAFVEGSNNSIDLMEGASGSDDIGDWTLEQIDVGVKIPGEQPAASDYTISLTLTIEAI